MPEPRPDCPVAAAIRDLIEALDRAGVPCCVLRNSEFLTEGVPYDNADIDLLIPARSLPAAHAILKKAGFARTAESTARGHIGYVAYLFPGRLAALDLHLEHLTWNDIPYLSGRRLLAERIVAGGAPVPNARHTAAMLVLHSILDKKAFKEKYVRILDRLRTKLDPESIQRTICPAIGSRLSTRITEALVRGDYGRLLDFRGPIIRRLLFPPSSAWIHLPICLFRSRWKRLRGRLFPPALLVALIGPDGAGKSTAIEGVSKALKALGIRTSRVYMGRWHSHILPLARLARAHGASSRATPEEPAGPAEPSPADPVRISGRPLYRLVRDAVYLLEMALRYLLRIRPALHSGGVVLADRYAYDLLLDPAATALPRLLLPALFPRPGLCFYLHHTAGVLHGRKREQSLDEIRRQLSAYDRYRRRLELISVRSESPDRTAYQIAAATLVHYFKIP